MPNKNKEHRTPLIPEGIQSHHMERAHPTEHLCDVLRAYQQTLDENQQRIINNNAAGETNSYGDDTDYVNKTNQSKKNEAAARVMPSLRTLIQQGMLNHSLVELGNSLQPQEVTQTISNLLDCATEQWQREYCYSWVNNFFCQGSTHAAVLRELNADNSPFQKNKDTQEWQIRQEANPQQPTAQSAV